MYLPIHPGALCSHVHPCGNRLTLNLLIINPGSSSSSAPAMLDTPVASGCLHSKTCLCLCCAWLDSVKKKTLSWHLGLGNAILEIGACFSLVLPRSSGFQRRLGGEYDFNLWPWERWGPKTWSLKHVGSRTVEVLFLFTFFFSNFSRIEARKAGGSLLVFVLRGWPA